MSMSGRARVMIAAGVVWSGAAWRPAAIEQEVFETGFGGRIDVMFASSRCSLPGLKLTPSA